MQISNQYTSPLDLFATESTTARNEEQAATTSLTSEGDSVTISAEARQLYAQKSGSAGSASQGSSDSEDTSQIESQIQSLQGQLAALQASGDDNAGEVAALQGQIASLKAQLG